MDKKLKKKIDENLQITGARQPNPVYCKTCMWSHGEPPFADTPDKANCMIYENMFKPTSVLFDGKECDFYQKELK